MQLDKELIKINPSERQVKFQQLEFYAFIHFTVNTFTDKEWGDGTESPEIFAPCALDAEQWVRAVKSAGMRGLILTCMHHDGFCLWNSELTKHNVMYSPYGKDIVREVSAACRKHGIKFGVYLSPWDRNSPLYGIENVTSDGYDSSYIPTSSKADIMIKLKQKEKLGYVVIKENILLSQRIEIFAVDAAVDGCFREVYRGTTVGYKRIVPLGGVGTDCVRIRITDSRVAPAVSFISVYRAVDKEP